MMVIPYDLFWQSISMAFSHQGRWNDKKSWGYLGDNRTHNVDPQKIAKLVYKFNNFGL